METTQRHDLSELGPALRRARRERGLTQQVLATRAGVTNVTLSDWERGRALPRRTEFDAVIRALDAGSDCATSLRRQLDSARTALRERRDPEPMDTRAACDLLWSMRLRRGLSQTDVARLLGVTQAKLSRWERGESWPEARHLHALCWHLGAASEEVAALTTRSVEAKGDPALLGVLEPGVETDCEEWVECLRRLMYHYSRSPALLDLTMLGVERKLAALATRHHFAAALLPDAYAIHARQLLNYGHERQASLWAERGLSHVRRAQRSANSAFTKIGQSLWFGNVILSARHRARVGTRVASLDAARLIKEWIPRLADDDWGHCAWGLSHIAHYLARAGHVDEAIAISRDATRPERSRNSVDRLNRHLECARLLLGEGRNQDAIKVLKPCYDLPNLEPGSTIRTYLVEAECLNAIGDSRSCNILLHHAEKECRQELRDWTMRTQSDAAPRTVWFTQKLSDLLAQTETFQRNVE